MGGNGPQHTLVMRGASPAKRPSRASLEAHHSQARRSLRTSIAPANFFSTAAAVEERLNAVTDTSRRDLRSFAIYLPTVECARVALLTSCVAVSPALSRRLVRGLSRSVEGC